MPSSKIRSQARPSSLATTLLLVALLLCATPAQPLRANVAQRERRVTTQSPTATRTPTPLATPTPAATQTPSPSPTATPATVTRQTSAAPATLEELRARLREILSKP